MTIDSTHVETLLKATEFAEEMHRDPGGVEASPYINHPIHLASIIASAGKFDDSDSLVATLLHNTIEAAEATAEDLAKRFGPRAKRLVQEVG